MHRGPDHLPRGVLDGKGLLHAAAWYPRTARKTRLSASLGRGQSARRSAIMPPMAEAGGEGWSNVVVVDDDDVDRELLRAEVAGRYSGAYRVVVGSSAAETLTTLE